MAATYVRVEGAQGVLKALRMMDAGLAKELGSEVASIGRRVRDDARTNATNRPMTINGTDMTGWRSGPPRRPRGKRLSTGAYSGEVLSRGGAGWPGWNEAIIDAGIKSARRDLSVTVSMSDAAATIYEFAGKESRGNSPQGRAFIRNLPPLPRDSGRILVRALKANYAQANRDLRAVVDRAVAEFNRRVA